MSWPKQQPFLSSEDVAINDDWQAYWLTLAQKSFSGIQKFNHEYTIRAGAKSRGPTLEIGSGDGEHIERERLAGGLSDEYHVIEMREDLANIVRRRFPQVDVTVGDCQKELPFESNSLRRIIAIHVLEHLNNLPAFLQEAARVLGPSGRLLVVIPCEGGLMYGLGRNATTKRLFEKRYNTSYKRFIRSEHLSTAKEVISELANLFTIESSEWWPLKVPSVHLNVCIGLCLAPRSPGSAR